MTYSAVEPGPLGGVTGPCEEEADDVGGDSLVPGIDPDFASLILSRLHRDEDKVELDIADLCHLGKRHPNKGGRKGLR